MLISGLKGLNMSYTGYIFGGSEGGRYNKCHLGNNQ